MDEPVCGRRGPEVYGEGTSSSGTATVRRCNVLYLLALIGAVTLAVLLWKAYGPTSRPPTRVMGPDDDPDFLWKVDREVHRRRSGDGTGESDQERGD